MRFISTTVNKKRKYARVEKEVEDEVPAQKPDGDNYRGNKSTKNMQHMYPPCPRYGWVQEHYPGTLIKY